MVDQIPIVKINKYNPLTLRYCHVAIPFLKCRDMTRYLEKELRGDCRTVKYYSRKRAANV